MRKLEPDLISEFPNKIWKMAGITWDIQVIQIHSGHEIEQQRPDRFWHNLHLVNFNGQSLLGAGLFCDAPDEQVKDLQATWLPVFFVICPDIDANFSQMRHFVCFSASPHLLQGAGLWPGPLPNWFMRRDSLEDMFCCLLLYRKRMDLLGQSSDCAIDLSAGNVSFSIGRLSLFCTK